MKITLFIIGIFILSLSIILQQQLVLSDLTNGLLKGASIGFLILSIFLMRKKPNLAPVRVKK